ncbi:MAG TPA: sulfite exporter TauE/SafE family protein [Gammaproteobacteria bacterium]|nr:sulfite exporter TauE/SafE family protein [Gammaproteobacteria bacterium]
MDLSLLNLFTAAGIITLGSVLQASTGLGSGLITVPLLALISLQFIPGPLIFASLTLSSLMAWRGRSSIDFRNVKTLTIGLIAGTAIGTLSISAVPLDRAGIVFGLLVLLAVAITAAGIQIRHNRSNLLAAGALSGFMGVTASIGAPVIAILYQREEARTLRATLAVLYCISSAVMVAFLHLGGRFELKELRLGLCLIPGFLIGYFLAAPIARVLDKGYSRIAVLVISTVSAIILIARSI